MVHQALVDKMFECEHIDTRAVVSAVSMHDALVRGERAIADGAAASLLIAYKVHQYESDDEISATIMQIVMQFHVDSVAALLCAERIVATDALAMTRCSDELYLRLRAAGHSTRDAMRDACAATLDVPCADACRQLKRMRIDGSCEIAPPKRRRHPLSQA